MKYGFLILLLCCAAYFVFLSPPERPLSPDDVSRAEAKRVHTQAVTLAVEGSVIRPDSTMRYFIDFARIHQDCTAQYALDYAQAFAVLVDSAVNIRQKTGRGR